jgi:hypothetical protein
MNFLGSFLVLILSLGFSQELPQWKQEARESLYDWDWNRQIESNFDAKVMHQKNRQAIQEIEAQEVDQNSSRVTGLKVREIEKLYNFAIHHPIAGLSSLSKYDPTGEIGFCFGRALFVHLELLRRGVSKDSIKKVFAVGDLVEQMNGKEITWQFHVATAVRDTQGEWWVIDPSYKLMKIRNWYKFMRQMATDRKLSVFVTQTPKIGPTAWEYNIQDGGLLDPFYNNYFKDLFQHFKQNPPIKDYRKKIRSQEGLTCRRSLSAST